MATGWPRPLIKERSMNTKKLSLRKLSLEETWKLCMSMWRWIAKQWRAGRRDVDALKREWLEKHGYKGIKIYNDCFFCQYVAKLKELSCSFCPGRKIDIIFNCNRVEYNFKCNPIAFYNKLVSLNRKRLAKRIK